MATTAFLHVVRKRQLELPWLIALALVGGSVGLLVLVVAGIGPTPLVHSAQFRFWVFLIALQTALWALGAGFLLSPPVRTPLAGLWSDARDSVAGNVLAAAVPLVGFAVLASLRSSVHYPMPYHHTKVLVLTLIGSAVALVGVAELILVKVALQREKARGTLSDIERFLELRTVLQRVLTVEGVILGAAILATGALRNAVLAYAHYLQTHPVYLHEHPHQAAYLHATFPHEYVLAYGAYLSLLLALFYAPVYFRLLDIGRKNVDAASKLPEPSSPDWVASYEKRKKLEEHLQLEVTTTASFRAGVAILAPLASALVALLLGTAN
jgi:hypothetical protein